MSQPATNARENPVPLCVDLDGTLIKTDLLWESLLRLLKRNPLFLLAVPFWWMRGRAFLKRQLAARVELDPATLPYNEAFLEFLREEKRQGRTLILATASDREPAARVAGHVGLFNEVLGSDGQANLRAQAKARVLAERFGERGFDYAGNSSADLPVWARAREAIVVNASDGLAKRAAQRAKVGRVFKPLQMPRERPGPVSAPASMGQEPDYFCAAAHVAPAWRTAAADGRPLGGCRLQFVRVRRVRVERPAGPGRGPAPPGKEKPSVCRRRSAAAGRAGDLSTPFSRERAGVAQAETGFAGILAVYFAATTSYSWRLKQVAILDVFVLAGLYSIRLVAGQFATGIVLSNWLLVFSMFIFLSLALARTVSGIANTPPGKQDRRQRPRLHRQRPGTRCHARAGQRIRRRTRPRALREQRPGENSVQRIRPGCCWSACFCSTGSAASGSSRTAARCRTTLWSFRAAQLGQLCRGRLDAGRALAGHVTREFGKTAPHPPWLRT